VLPRPSRGGTRDAESQNGTGDHSRPRQARTAAERVYRLLYNRDLYLLAYGKIARNHGALTPEPLMG
jgi:hypothetical protein